ncbi:hypothetical protein BOW51_05915 [Solemya velesiana gill symbiont]|uniref:Uncharacterized protein n=2 Tax=Solemya velesiana gill symbiont TaxID=1918948 RepID=A0A1T2KV30_9GAMM|nr:hypothetical protein BOW51_05915 [Solemya velesiana gill symbiont]
METALDAARRMRAADVDPHHIAHCLIYLQDRSVLMEDLLTRIERYLHFGLPEEEHIRIQWLVDKIREMEKREGGVDELDYGL